MPPQTLNPLDLFDVRGLLSDEERLVQDSVARMVGDKVMPLIAKAFEEHRFPKELVPDMAALGLLGSSLEGYGCAGMNAVASGLICQELERGDSALRSFVSVQSSLCMYPIHAFGTEAQKQRYLPAMARGELIGCFGLTEPHGGSDPGNMKTHARRQGGDLSLIHISFLVDQARAFAARIGCRLHRPGSEIPGDHLHVAPRPAALLEFLSLGLQHRDLLGRQRTALVIDDVGQILLVVMRIFDDVRGAHAVHIVERCQQHHADDEAAAGRSDDHHAVLGRDECRRHARQRALLRRDGVGRSAHQTEGIRLIRLGREIILSLIHI